MPGMHRPRPGLMPRAVLDAYDGERMEDVQCKYCKTDNLYWAETSKGWRLRDIDTDEDHDCRDTNIDAFDKIG